MANVKKRFDAISFDLFGTLVFVEGARLPRILVDGHERIITIPSLADQLARLNTTATIADFIDASFEVAAEMAKQKAVDNVEVPSQQRFVRILTRLGVGGQLDAIAHAMSVEHMNTLAQAVVSPAGRADLLRELGRRFRLVLISNFDHATTARAILRRDGLDAAFDALVISEEVGICKPAVAIFATACERLAVEPARCLHIGDSWRADVEGAYAAGLEAVWVSAEAARDQRRGIAAGRISDVGELPLWLGLDTDA